MLCRVSARSIVTIEGTAFSIESARNLVNLKLTAPSVGPGLGGYPSQGAGDYHQHVQQAW